MSAAGLLDIIEELEGNTEDRASVPSERPLTIPGRNIEDRASVSTERPLNLGKNTEDRASVPTERPLTFSGRQRRLDGQVHF